MHPNNVSESGLLNRISLLSDRIADIPIGQKTTGHHNTPQDAPQDARNHLIKETGNDSKAVRKISGLEKDEMNSMQSVKL